MKPIRIKEQYEVTDDPATGHERILGSTYEEDILSDRGSINTLGKVTHYALHCGCYDEIGGRCYECGAISCVKCHGRCAVCSCPICQAHSIFVPSEGGRQLKLCRQCYDKTVRRRRIVGVTRFLLSPFIRFERRHENRT